MKKNVVVVFSSHQTDEVNQKFIKHIHETIGCSHKVVCYPNFNQYSLPQVYNVAIDEHNDSNTIMVFCHYDITFKTRNWGKVLLNKFNHFNFQIIGVAGSTYLHSNGIWWHDRSHMYGIVEHTNGISEWVSEYSPHKVGYIQPVVLIDGLFMAIDCDNIIHKFDEDFKGYHMYDVSFCVPNYLDGVNIGVTTDIRILHQSVGMTNDQWEENRKQFVEKYEDELPFSIADFYD